jgi:hypothetical protein
MLETKKLAAKILFHLNGKPPHVEVSPDIEYRDIIQPDEVITWVDIDGNERPWDLPHG